MDDNRFSVILFDLGRVLVNIDFDAFPRGLGLAPEHANPEDRRSVGQLVVQYETGRIATDAFLRKLAALLGGRYSEERLLNAWNAIIQEDNAAIAPIVEEVQSRYRTAVLSNTSPTHFQKALAESRLLKRFTKHYLSYQIGAMKPDPAVFEYVIRDLAVQPGEVVFIDDIAENVAAANKQGLVGIIFEGIPDLQRNLRKLGILRERH